MNLETEIIKAIRAIKKRKLSANIFPYYALENEILTELKKLPEYSFSDSVSMLHTMVRYNQLKSGKTINSYYYIEV